MVAQARFAVAMRESARDRRQNRALNRVVIHERCVDCGQPWLLLWQPERRRGDRREHPTESVIVS
jgi:hypothetical protein